LSETRGRPRINHGMANGTSGETREERRRLWSKRGSFCARALTDLCRRLLLVFQRSISQESSTVTYMSTHVSRLVQLKTDSIHRWKSV